jgi:hypothetical protein
MGTSPCNPTCHRWLIRSNWPAMSNPQSRHHFRIDHPHGSREEMPPVRSARVCFRIGSAIAPLCAACRTNLVRTLVFSSIVLKLLLIFPAAGQPAQQPKLKFLLVEGHGAINLVNKKTERTLQVRVEERYGTPGKGIAVTFTLPRRGPSGYFHNREQIAIVNTDDAGYAVVRGFRPNKLVGEYGIRVSAWVPGGLITASIPQTNAVRTRPSPWEKPGSLFSRLSRVLRRLWPFNAKESEVECVECETQTEAALSVADR